MAVPPFLYAQICSALRPAASAAATATPAALAAAAAAASVTPAPLSAGPLSDAGVRAADAACDCSARGGAAGWCAA